MRALVALVAAALGWWALPVPVAVAATPAQTELYLADLNGDVTYGVYRRATSGGAASAVVPDSPDLDHAYLSSSQDGSRFAAVEEVLDPVTRQAARERIQVYDISGRLAATLADVSTADAALSAPALSPDGTSVVWASYDPRARLSALLWSSVGGGTPTTVATGVSSAVFVDPTTLLVQEDTGGWQSLSLTSGARAAVTGLPQTASEPAVSADGRQLAWRAQTTPQGAYPVVADVDVAPLSVSPGGVTVGSAVTVASGGDNGSPSFTRDGSTVWFVRDDGATGQGAVLTAPSDGSAPAGSAVPTAGDVAEQSTGTTDDGTAPGAAAVGPATLGGTTATLRWSLPAASDLSGVVVVRHDPSGQQTSAFVVAPVTTYADSHLVVGSTYTYDVVAVDRSGNSAPAARLSLTATAVQLRYADPTSTTAVRAPFVVRFGPASEPGARFTVDYRVGGTSRWVRWVTNAPGTARQFGGALGSTYTFRAVATDAFGNRTATYTGGPAVVPLDQSRAALVGGRDLASRAAWMGTVRVLSSTASYARIVVTGNQLRVVGWRCRSCGTFAVYEGHRLLAKVSTYASTTVPRAVVFTRTWATTGTRTVTIRPLGTPGHPAVYVDGFAVRR